VSPIGTVFPSSQCLPYFVLHLKVAHPVLRLQQIIVTAFCFAYMFFAWLL